MAGSPKVGVGKPTPSGRANGRGGRIATQRSLDAKVWAICDILRRSNCVGVVQYVPELTWILLPRIVDEREEQKGAEVLAAPRR